MHAPNTPSQPPAGAPAGAKADHAIDESLLEELCPAEYEALRWSVCISDGLTAEAQAEFQAWLEADPAHRAAYDDMAGVWGAIDQIPPAGNARLRTTVAIDIAAASSAQDLTHKAGAAEALAQAGSALPPLAMPPPMASARATQAPLPSRFCRLVPQAGAAVVALAMLGGWLGWAHWQSQPVFSRHYASERGQSLNVALPDGSGLLLDTASQADVSLYRHRREVRMSEGQVVFQVQADKARPFDVLAGAARITVVGTRFAVRYTPSLGSQAVQVAVIEGRVRVAANSAVAEAGQNVIDIAAGQMVNADPQGRLGEVTDVATDAIASWRSQRLNFDGVPLAGVLAEIGRYGDIPVHLADAEVGRWPVTASVDLRRLDAFVRTLPKVLPVRLVSRDDGMAIVDARRR